MKYYIHKIINDVWYLNFFLWLLWIFFQLNLYSLFYKKNYKFNDVVIDKPSMRYSFLSVHFMTSGGHYGNTLRLLILSFSSYTTRYIMFTAPHSSPVYRKSFTVYSTRKQNYSTLNEVGFVLKYNISLGVTLMYSLRILKCCAPSVGHW